MTMAWSENLTKRAISKSTQTRHRSPQSGVEYNYMYTASSHSFTWRCHADITAGVCDVISRVRTTLFSMPVPSICVHVLWRHRNRGKHTVHVPWSVMMKTGAAGTWNRKQNSMSITTLQSCASFQDSITRVERYQVKQAQTFQTQYCIVCIFCQTRRFGTVTHKHHTGAHYGVTVPSHHWHTLTIGTIF